MEMPFDAELIALTGLSEPRKRLPHAATHGLHWKVFLVPEVEIARHAHRLRLRRPGPEHESVNTVPILRVTAEKPVGV